MKKSLKASVYLFFVIFIATVQRFDLPKPVETVKENYFEKNFQKNPEHQVSCCFDHSVRVERLWRRIPVKFL